MTRRQAKREACHSAAMQLETNLNVMDCPERFSEEEWEQVAAALAELIAELKRRGSRE